MISRTEKYKERNNKEEKIIKKDKQRKRRKKKIQNVDDIININFFNL